MNNKIMNNPLVSHLIDLSNPDMIGDDRNVLTLIVQLLFLHLDKGNSCIFLDQIYELAKQYKIDFKPNISIKLIEDILNRSGLVSKYKLGSYLHESKPLILMIDDDNPNTLVLYVARHLCYEYQIARFIKLVDNKSTLDLLTIEQVTAELSLLSNSGFPNQDQIFAIKSSALHKFSIITGGPGTGKTTTVILLLWVLSKCYKNKIVLNICAPTGRAASRIKESIISGITQLKKWLDMSILEDWLKIDCVTIHRLLGYQRDSIYFKHNKNNLLKTEVLIVDESSMVSLPLFYKLCMALDINQLKHLVLLGDKNQLSSVEEGYVFASLVDYYKGNNLDLFSSNIVNQLLISNRNQMSVQDLANNILNQDIKQVVANLNEYSELGLIKPNYSQIANYLFKHEDGFCSYFTSIEQLLINDNFDKGELFTLLRKLVILCITNDGILGANNLNQQIDEYAREYFTSSSKWYNGRSIIILENDYTLGLNNGDVGVCLLVNSKPVIIFENGSEFIPEVLPSYKLAYAITIHKSQGSEFERVMVVLPDSKTTYNNYLLSCELLYTAVTRAKFGVLICANLDTLKFTINNLAPRNSGLGYLLNSI